MKDFKFFITEDSLKYVDTEMFDDGGTGFGSAGMTFTAELDDETIIDGAVYTKDGLINSDVQYTEKPSAKADPKLKKWVETKLMKGIKITPAYAKKFSAELENKVF